MGEAPGVVAKLEDQAPIQFPGDPASVLVDELDDSPHQVKAA